MVKINSYFYVIFYLSTLLCSAQSVEIRGQVLGYSDIEGIHVINKTLNKFTTTTKSGTFSILVQLNDTIVFSSIQYKLTSVQVTKKIFNDKKISISLEEKINKLPQVTVGKVLSGDIEFDLRNNKVDKPIDFYDVGIPGYVGKPKTQNERRLFEADAGKMIYYYGFLLSINFHKFLNTVSGRTKMLKKRVKQESDMALLQTIKSNVSEDFFNNYPLNENLRNQFFYFCTDDMYFESRCKGKSSIEVYNYLEEKYGQFIERITKIND